MNFEEKGMNEESFIGKVLKIRFFDSLIGDRRVAITLQFKVLIFYHRDLLDVQWEESAA